MLAFLMDHQIHLAITQGLRGRGIDVVTVLEDGRAEADDELLLERATELGRVFVSQDYDLLRIPRRWQRIGRDFAGVAFGFQEALDIGGTIEYLELIAQAMTADEMRSRVEYIPARS
jgi:hypothetical protein